MSHRILLCTSWFRPQLGLDMGADLMDRLNKRGLSVVGVIGPDEQKLASEAALRSLPYFALLPEFRWTSATIRRRLTEDPGFSARLEAWCKPIRDLGADLGVLYFATWIPPALLKATQRGWLNFHPAPLPELRGFLPEDFALLWGWSTMPGTLHVATDAIDEGPIILKSRPAKLSKWDTPDSVMQKVGETARGCLVSGILKYLRGTADLQEQKHIPGFYAGYKEFYPESWLQWTLDSHDKLQRRFQTFRGQQHRVDLKAEIGSESWEIQTMELHRCRARGKPGDVLGHWRNLTIVRTTEGVALLQGIPFVPDSGLGENLDRREQDIIAPGYRANTHRVAEFRHLLR